MTKAKKIVEPVTFQIDWSGESDSDLLENLATLLQEVDDRGIDLNNCPQFTRGDYLTDRCAPDDGDPCCGAKESGLDEPVEFNTDCEPMLAECVQAAPHEYKRSLVTTVTRFDHHDRVIDRVVTETVETNS